MYSFKKKSKIITCTKNVLQFVLQDRHEFHSLALLRPHLDYGMQLCSPYYEMSIESQARVEQEVTKMIHNFSNLLSEQTENT